MNSALGFQVRGDCVSVSRSRQLTMGKLEKLIPWFAGMIASYGGWYLGALNGMFLGFMLSIVGFGVGVYFGKKWVAENL